MVTYMNDEWLAIVTFVVKHFVGVLVLKVMAGGVHEVEDDDLSVYDFKGQPADKSRTGGWLGAGLILGNFILSHPHTNIYLHTLLVRFIQVVEEEDE